jgi:hypothetical protein
MLAFLDVANSQAVGTIGKIVNGNPMSRAVVGAVPSDEGLADVWTIAATSPDSSAAYSIRVEAAGLEAFDLAFTTDGSATAGELEAGLAAAWNASPIASGLAVAVAGSDLVITGRGKGADFAFTVSIVLNPSSALAITHTQTAADATAIQLGRFVALSASNKYGPAAGYPSLPSAGTAVLTIGHAATTDYSVRFIYMTPTGSAVLAAVTFSSGGSASATATAAAAAFNSTLSGVATAATSVAGSNVTLTLSFLPGFAATSWAGLDIVSGTGTLTAGAFTAPGLLAQLGVAIDPGDLSPESIGGSADALRAGSVISVLLAGSVQSVVVADPGASITLGARVYVETSGSNVGRPYTTASATRVLHPSARWLRSLGASLAIVEL